MRVNDIPAHTFYEVLESDTYQDGVFLKLPNCQSKNMMTHEVTYDLNFVARVLTYKDCIQRLGDLGSKGYRYVGNLPLREDNLPSYVGGPKFSGVEKAPEFVEPSANMKKEKIKKADRFNDGKPELSLIPLDYLEPAARVLAYGAEKYSRNNFRLGLSQNKIIDSLLRHIADLQSGKTIDEESKCAIIGHIQANAIFLGGENNYE